MRFRWLLLLAVFVFASGCMAQTHNARPPQPPPTEAAPTPAMPPSAAASPVTNLEQTTTPSPGPAAGLRNQLAAGTWCNDRLPWAERERALMAALPAILGNQEPSQIDRDLNGAPVVASSGLSCLRVQWIREYDALLIRTPIVYLGGAVFATRVDGGWRLTAVQPPTPGWGLIEDTLDVEATRPGANGPDLIFVGGTGGPYGFKTLLRGQVSKSGDLTITPVSKAYTRTSLRFLSPDLVFLTQRADEEGPVLETCNACQPTRQVLLKWSGNAYAAVASRVVSTPYMAANLFLGAMQAGDKERALRYAASRAVVEKLPPITWGLANSLAREACSDLERSEFDHWDLDLLPSDWRNPLPPTASSCTMKLGSKITLQMRRTPAGWVVADITP